MDAAQRLDQFVQDHLDLASAVQAGRDALLREPAKNAAIDGLEHSLQAALARVAELEAPAPDQYTVKAGDTLLKIGRTYRVQVADIKTWNGLTSDTIRPGQVLRLREPERQPDPAPARTIFGMNNETSMAATIARFGSAPMVKLFDGGSGILPNVAGIVPSKRGQACFKPNMADLAAGRLNATITAWINNQLAAGAQELIITPWQEPNGELKAGSLNLQTYLDGCLQIAKVIASDGELGKVFLGQTFTADQPRNGVDVPDTWILRPDQVGGIERARLCLDNYGNPAGAAAYGGDAYATPYPTPEQVSGSAYAQVLRTGYGDNYGISEWNYPWRKNLPDADHKLRLAAFEAHMQWWTSRPKPPRHVFLWTGKGVQFDQKLTDQAEVDFWKGWLARSA